VFVETGVAPLPQPPRDPKGTFNPWDWGKVKLPEESVIITKPDPYSGQIPPGPKPPSLESKLDELLSSISSRWLRRKIRNAVLSGACAFLEFAFKEARGQLREKDKEELRKRCLERSKSPIK
jgi:hypothetical protein